MIKECPICYDSGTLDKLKCSHLVCKLCISKLINRVCPFCRVSIDDDNSKGVFHEEVEIDFGAEFISTEIYTFDYRSTRRLRRRRTREHNREVEDIITHIFSIPLNVSFIDLEDTERDLEVSGNTSSRRKSSRRKSSRRKSSRDYWKTSDYPRRRRIKRSKR